jgi:hypothetical protein
MTKALVCGGRDYRNVERLTRVLDAAVERLGVDAIVQGGQKSVDYETGDEYGADWLAKQWAIGRQLQCETFYANWAEHGDAAGPIRNRKMRDEAKPDLGIAFQGGKGTRGMVRLLEEVGIPVHRIDWTAAWNTTTANRRGGGHERTGTRADAG